MESIKAQKKEKDNTERLIVTVDIGKISNMGYYRFSDKRDVRPFVFYNNGQGFKRFWERIEKVMATNKIREVVVGFESTGAYGEPLVHYLMKKPVKIVQVNPMHVKRVKELQGNSPNKTDKKDPKVIADIVELGHALSVLVPKGSAAELRRLSHAREREMQRNKALFNQLHDLIFIIFPEFLHIFKDLKAKSVRYLFEHYPGPQSIIECGLDQLSVILRKISRGQLGTQRAEVLYDAAGVSGGIQEGNTTIIYEIRHILSLIKRSDQFIKDMEQRLAECLGLISYSKFILSIKGIGVITAAGLIGEVGDFREFKTVSEITKLAGLDLFEISSGEHRGNRHISKRGRPLMRKILFFAALNLVRKGCILHETYMGYLNRGMIKMKALIAIARKLLRIIYALVRNRVEYLHGYNKATNCIEVAA